jgi:hypothetical protein
MHVYVCIGMPMHAYMHMQVNIVMNLYETSESDKMSLICRLVQDDNDEDTFQEDLPAFLM